MLESNVFTARGVYPSATGQTVATLATGPGAPSVAQKADVGGSGGSEVEQAAAVGMQGNLAIAGLVLFALLFGLMFLAKRLGTDDDFKSLKPSFYNVITVSLAAAVGLPIWKFVFTKLKVPGVSAWILAA